VVTTYDRGELIERSIKSLKTTLIEELVVVSVVILLFLWHIPSAIIPMITIPVAILISFIPLQALGQTANIMSLGGIAIAIGAMVDAAIVVVEQTHKRLEEWHRNGEQGSGTRVIIDAVKEVGGPSFFALLVIVLLYLNTRSMAKTALILLAVPFSAAGAIWLLYALGYQMSVGVWVGLIALLGVDAETGVFMLLYLDIAYEKARSEGRLGSLKELQTAILEGAVKRIRPKFMTVATMLAGLAPVLWATGAGADVMKRVAAPMVGGIGTSFLLELLVYPALCEVWKWHFELKKQSSL
jgi:Cu/Ag efflux pump CusA